MPYVPKTYLEILQGYHDEFREGNNWTTYVDTDIEGCVFTAKDLNERAERMLTDRGASLNDEEKKLEAIVCGLLLGRAEPLLGKMNEVETREDWRGLVRGKGFNRAKGKLVRWKAKFLKVGMGGADRTAGYTDPSIVSMLDQDPTNNDSAFLKFLREAVTDDGKGLYELTAAAATHQKVPQLASLLQVSQALTGEQQRELSKIQDLISGLSRKVFRGTGNGPVGPVREWTTSTAYGTLKGSSGTVGKVDDSKERVVSTSGGSDRNSRWEGSDRSKVVHRRTEDVEARPNQSRGGKSSGGRHPSSYRKSREEPGSGTGDEPVFRRR